MWMRTKGIKAVRMWCLLLLVGAVSAQSADPETGDRVEFCKDSECNGCLSAPQCRNESSDSKCKVAGHDGKCIVIKSCLGGACCGCEVGGLTFLGGGVIYGADGLYYGPDGSVLDEPSQRGGPALANQELTVVFRVYDHAGSPVHNAEVTVRAVAPDWFKASRRGTTVQGLFQTFVPCASSQPNWPSQILYEYQVWSAAGKVFRGSWWQSGGGWTCNQTRDIPVRLQPPLDD